MCAVLVGFCQSQIGEPIKLAAIPIHMNHILKMRDFANDSINRDEWNRHRIVESGNLPHTNRAQPIGHGLGIGFRPARQITSWSESSPRVTSHTRSMPGVYHGDSHHLRGPEPVRDVTVRPDEAARFGLLIRDSGQFREPLSPDERSPSEPDAGPTANLTPTRLRQILACVERPGLAADLMMTGPHTGGSMRIQGVLATAFCACLLALDPGSADVSASHEPDAVKSKVNLKLLDSKSSVTPINNNYFTIVQTFYGAIWQQKFVGDLLISGYANKPYVTGLTPTGTNAILPAFIIHDTSANTLNEKGRITLPAGEGILSVSISPVSDRPYLVLSRITSSQTTTFPGSIVPVGPYDYTLELYSYNPDGTINPVPVDILIWGVDYNPPGINTSVITFNAAVNFSHDGKYLFYTYTSGSLGALNQHLGAFEIAPNGTFNNTPVAESPLPVGPIVGVDNFFPQSDIKTFIHPNNSTNYKTVAGLVGFTPGNPTGGNTQAGMVNS